MDRKLHFCFGSSRQAAKWLPGEMSLEELMARLNSPAVTDETVEQYQAMTKAEKDSIKDRGAFMAGTLKGTRRLKSEVVSRSMITLDGDELQADFFSKFAPGYKAVVYTTHSHLPERPRARIMFPLTRDVLPDEFNAITRYLASEIGMEKIDPCSMEVNQMMYFPTVSVDGEYICRQYEGEWLDPDAFLKEHPYWKDFSHLPRSSRETKPPERANIKAEDPLTKTGPVGDFCRAYTVQEAIEKFLSDVYAATDQDDRYDFIAGQGSRGVVIYDGKFAYSHHATDPAGGRVCNAFDLVRIHMFGTEDETVSYKSMCEFVVNDEKVQQLARAEKEAEAKSDFAPADPSWDAPIYPDDEALPEFPMDALTPTLRDYAAAIAESTQTAPDMAAVGILAAVSAAMRNLYKVRGKDDWYEPTNIYSLIIAEPSERKSAVNTLIMKPVTEYVNRYNAEHKVEFEMSAAMKQKLENRKNALVSGARKKGADTGADDFNDALQEVVHQLVNFEEKRPLKIFVDDTTPEKLVETLSQNNNAIALISSEGGIFDVLSGAYANRVNIDVFLKAYSGESIIVDRIMRNSVTIEEACLTILLSVQPVVISDIMKNEKFRHRGLTARFLYTHPKSLVGSRDFDSEGIPERAYENYRELIFNILSEERGKKAEIISPDREAEAELREFYNWVERRLVDEFSAYSDWIGKLVGNTLRIAGILARSAVIKKDVADSFLEEDEDIVISGEIMRNAIRIGRYFFSHAIRAYSTMGVYSEHRALQKAVAKLKEKGERIINRRDIMRLCRWVTSAEEAQRHLDLLEDFGYVRLIAVDASDKLRGGRPKNPTFAVNPMVFE